MGKYRNKTTGALLTLGDDAAGGRLGPDWGPVKEPATKKAPSKKSDK